MAGVVPPNDEEAEKATLGSLLLNEAAIPKAIDILGEGGQMFYTRAHQSIYSEIINLYREREPVDLVALTRQLTDRKELKKVGGAVYIAGLTDAVPTSAHVEHYAKIVLERWKQRTLITACTEAVRHAYAGDSPAAEIAKILLSETSTAMEAGKTSGVVHICEVLPGVMSEIERLREANLEITGASTGMAKLDSLLLGLRPDTLNIIGARPSLGKSAIAVNIADSAAQNGHPVLMFSLEMSRHSLARRFLTLNTLTSYRTLSGRDFVDIQNRKIADAVGKMSSAKIYVDDSSRLNMYSFTSRCRRFAALHEGIMPVIIVDYLQLCEFNESKFKNRNELIGEFTRECKLIAGELNCPIILLCQLSRLADSLSDPFRGMGTLKESGNIEADADTISIALQEKPTWLLDAAAQCGITDEDKLIHFAVIKNRDGPVGLCPLVFDKQCQHIITLADYHTKWEAENAVATQAEFNEGEDPLG